MLSANVNDVIKIYEINKRLLPLLGDGKGPIYAVQTANACLVSDSSDALPSLSLRTVLPKSAVLPAFSNATRLSSHPLLLPKPVMSTGISICALNSSAPLYLDKASHRHRRAKRNQPRSLSKHEKSKILDARDMFIKNQVDGNEVLPSVQVLPSTEITPKRCAELPRSRRKEVHNADEKRRKGRISSWISRIGKLLCKDPNAKQSKNSILEAAFNYIENATDSCITSACSKACGERIKRLEACLAVLFELLELHSIPVPELVQGFSQQTPRACFGSGAEAAEYIRSADSAPTQLEESAHAGSPAEESGNAGSLSTIVTFGHDYADMAFSNTAAEKSGRGSGVDPALAVIDASLDLRCARGSNSDVGDHKAELSVVGGSSISAVSESQSASTVQSDSISSSCECVGIVGSGPISTVFADSTSAPCENPGMNESESLRVQDFIDGSPAVLVSANSPISAQDCCSAMPSAFEETALHQNSLGVVQNVQPSGCQDSFHLSQLTTIQQDPSLIFCVPAPLASLALATLGESDASVYFPQNVFNLISSQMCAASCEQDLLNESTLNSLEETYVSSEVELGSEDVAADSIDNEDKAEPLKDGVAFEEEDMPMSLVGLNTGRMLPMSCQTPISCPEIVSVPPGASEEVHAAKNRWKTVLQNTRKSDIMLTSFYLDSKRASKLGVRSKRSKSRKPSKTKSTEKVVHPALIASGCKVQRSCLHEKEEISIADTTSCYGTDGSSCLRFDDLILHQGPALNCQNSLENFAEQVETEEVCTPEKRCLKETDSVIIGVGHEVASGSLCFHNSFSDVCNSVAKRIGLPNESDVCASQSSSKHSKLVSLTSSTDARTTRSESSITVTDPDGKISAVGSHGSLVTSSSFVAANEIGAAGSVTVDCSPYSTQTESCVVSPSYSPDKANIKSVPPTSTAFDQCPSTSSLLSNRLTVSQSDLQQAKSCQGPCATIASLSYSVPAVACDSGTLSTAIAVSSSGMFLSDDCFQKDCLLQVTSCATHVPSTSETGQQHLNQSREAARCRNSVPHSSSSMSRVAPASFKDCASVAPVGMIKRTMKDRTVRNKWIASELYHSAHVPTEGFFSVDRFVGGPSDCSVDGGKLLDDPESLVPLAECAPRLLKGIRKRGDVVLPTDSYFPKPKRIMSLADRTVASYATAIRDSNSSSAKIFSAELLSQSASTVKSSSEQSNGRTPVSGELCRVVPVPASQTGSYVFPGNERLKHLDSKGSVKNESSPLPTILNIFAPASMPNLPPTNISERLTSSHGVSFARRLSTNLCTLQPVASSFSADSLLNSNDFGSDISHHLHLDPGNLAHDDIPDALVLPGTSQSLFTDFSADTLIGSTDTNLSYAIDNLIGHNTSSHAQSFWSSGAVWVSQNMGFPNDTVFSGIYGSQVEGARHQRPTHSTTGYSPIKSIDNILGSQHHSQLPLSNMSRAREFDKVSGIWSNAQPVFQRNALENQSLNLAGHLPLSTPLSWMHFPGNSFETAVGGQVQAQREFEAIPALQTSRSKDSSNCTNESRVQSKPGPSFGSFLLVNSGK